MMQLSDSERQRAFSIRLRTGSLSSLRREDGVELKFNPWHDVETGRFTFVGGGRFFGPSSSGHSPRRERPSQPASTKAVKREPIGLPGRAAAAAGSHGPDREGAPRSTRDGVAARGGTWTDPGFSGGGGGRFNGGVATGTFLWGAYPSGAVPSSSRRRIGGIEPGAGDTANGEARKQFATAAEKFHTVVRNGYTYEIDARERTRHVFGALTVSNAPTRSRMSQARAGGAERRPRDDGGHYIAARFNGPTEAFNHFAQDANFNRGSYRLLEDEWARDKRAGSAVALKIVPQFGDNSVRPSKINVWWMVNGKEKARDLRMSDRTSAVAETETERLLNEIGQLLMEDGDYPFEPTLLYAQLDHNMAGESIFKELGNHFLYRRPLNERLLYALLELWEAQGGQDRWSELEYVLRDGQFSVAYFYPDEIDPREDLIERRERALRRHFGEKPIVYPRFELEGHAQSHDL